MKSLVRTSLFLLLPLIFTTSLHATTYAGKVIAITDGDTIKILTSDKQQIKVRLASIDTPEKGQPYGQKAREPDSLSAGLIQW